MENFCKELKDHATKTILKKGNATINKRREKIYQKQKVCYIYKRNLVIIMMKRNKVRDHCHYTGKYRVDAHNICNLKYRIPKTIPVVFHNGSNYDHHIIKKMINKNTLYLQCCTWKNNT